MDWVDKVPALTETEASGRGDTQPQCPPWGGLLSHMHAFPVAAAAVYYTLNGVTQSEFITLQLHRLNTWHRSHWADTELSVEPVSFHVVSLVNLFACLVQLPKVAHIPCPLAPSTMFKANSSRSSPSHISLSLALVFCSSTSENLCGCIRSTWIIQSNLCTLNPNH